MVDQQPSEIAMKHVDNAHMLQGATIELLIRIKNAKMVQYLKDSSVFISDSIGDDNVNDNSCFMNKSNDDITEHLDKNYGQRERQMKLKHIDLYIKLNQMEKANELMWEVEERSKN